MFRSKTARDWNHEPEVSKHSVALFPCFPVSVSSSPLEKFAFALAAFVTDSAQPKRSGKCSSSVPQKLFRTPVTATYPHREKHKDCPESLSFLKALVVRPIAPGSPEFKSPGALAAVDKELKRLTEGRVWLIETAREWSEVVASKVPATVSRIHVILGMKFSEMSSEQGE
jgi:hypothetical protein